MQKPITIVGGGLAGLTLGIGLREKGVPVKIWEAGTYPRHRVCGEFISGRGQETLERLGLRERLVKAGARPGQTAAFFSRQKSSPTQEFDNPALCISRYILDDLLASRFRELGGELRTGERWQESEVGEGVVRASGRKMQAAVNGWRWYGLKVHAKNVQLTADLEMHVSPVGYVGICRLKDGEVNICGLFRRSNKTSTSAQHWKETLRGAPGSLIHGRLAGATFDEDSFCSVAGLSLKPKRATASHECCIGDALTMIPPVTGNGMSMAFESAEVAIGPLTEYSEGRISWQTAQSTIARRCDELFMRRLAWAEQLQHLMFVPQFQETLVSVLPGWDWLWKLLFKQTR